MKGDPRMVSALRAPNQDTFHISMPSVGELWYMVYKSSQLEANARKLENLLQSLVILAFDQAAARHFGRLRAELHRVGRPIPSIDLQIAAIAVDLNLTVLTSDAHFGNIPGLRLNNWIAS